MGTNEHHNREAGKEFDFKQERAKLFKDLCVPTGVSDLIIELDEEFIRLLKKRNAKYQGGSIDNQFIDKLAGSDLV